MLERNHRGYACRFVALLALCCAATAQAAVPMLPRGQTRAVADGVYVIPDMRVSLVPNVGIVVGDDSVLVVDTGMGPANAAIVLDEVRAVTDKPIRWLVCTHFHPEHSSGAQAFPEETSIVYSIAQHEDLRRKGERYREWFVELFGDQVRDLLAPVRLVDPDLTFERRAQLDLGGLPVELLHLGHPAHTGGDTLVYLPRQKLLFTGDLTPSGFFPIMPDADSSGAGWIASLEALERMDVETIVPGHGEIAGPELIGQVKRYLLEVRARVAEQAAAGRTLEEIKAALEPTIRAAYPDWDEPHWIGNAIETFFREAGG